MIARPAIALLGLLAGACETAQPGCNFLQAPPGWQPPRALVAVILVSPLYERGARLADCMDCGPGRPNIIRLPASALAGPCAGALVLHEFYHAAGHDHDAHGWLKGGE